MKTKLIPVLILAAGLLGTASAAEPASAAVPAAPAPAPDRTIFAPRLPSPAELTDIAAAQGQSIERIEQTASQVTVTTKAADGRATVVLYQLLSTAANAPARIAPAPRATVTSVVVQDDDPEVVYVPRYRYYPSYDPVWDYWPPVTLGIGLGWGFRGGYHGHGGHYGGWHHR